MTSFFYIVSTIASLLLGFLELMMLLRAIMSWFFMDDENAILRFAYAVTEPFIYPVRLLLDRIPAIRELPLDISFFVTFLLLSLLQMFL